MASTKAPAAQASSTGVALLVACHSTCGPETSIAARNSASAAATGTASSESTSATIVRRVPSSLSSLRIVPSAAPNARPEKVQSNAPCSIRSLTKWICRRSNSSATIASTTHDSPAKASDPPALIASVHTSSWNSG